MRHADKADKLLIKPAAGARPASPHPRGRIIPKARTRAASHLTSHTRHAETRLATAPDGPTGRVLPSLDQARTGRAVANLAASPRSASARLRRTSHRGSEVLTLWAVRVRVVRDGSRAVPAAGTEPPAKRHFSSPADQRGNYVEAGGRLRRVRQPKTTNCRMFSAGTTGFEPATSGVTGRSWHLRAERG
jgi:hypothetical protein